MSNKAQILAALVGALEPYLGPLGFKYQKSQETFIRKEKDYDQRIVLNLDRRAGTNILFLMVGVSVRLKPIEDIINACKPGLPKRDLNWIPTATRLLFNLYPRDQEMDEWNLASEQDVSSYIDEIKDRIQRYGLPFLEKFKEVDELIACLESDTGDWPVPTEQQRAEVLVASYLFLRDRKKLQLAIPKLRRNLSIVRDGFYLGYFDEFLECLAKQAPEFAEVMRRR